MGEITLRSFDPELDMERLRDWLSRPHVVRWWGNLDQELQHALQRPGDTHAIIVADETPVGYVCWQIPTRDELAEAGLTDLPRNLVDIDIVIGEPDYIGRGIGPEAIRILLARLHREAVFSCAGLGTSVSNTRAIRAYAKAGFRLFRDFQDPEHGPCRYMWIDLRDASQRQ